QCERLGQETGCWLVIAAAPRGHGHATHYISNTMRQEARGDATEILNKFQTTVGALKRARMQEAFTISQGLIRMEEQNAELLAAEQAARLALAEKE
ncbi:hypothetical protein FB451DRAFT_978371, partial [Mycena latifolia]